MTRQHHTAAGTRHHNGTADTLMPDYDTRACLALGLSVYRFFSIDDAIRTAGVKPATNPNPKKRRPWHPKCY
jgi:hypothetical protein